MDYTSLPKRLQQVANMSAFAKASGIPRRTLERVASGGGNPSLGTCQRIADALTTHKPAKLKAPKA